MVEAEVAAANKPLPIEKLRVQGNHLISLPPRQTNSTMPLTQPSMRPPSSPLSVTPETQAQIDKQPSLLRRYEFIRRTMVVRSENTTSPTFVIEGKKVDSRESLKQGEPKLSYLSGKISPLDFLLNNEITSFETRKPLLPPKPKSEGPQISKGATSVALPVLRINGPGCSQQVSIAGKSISLPDTSHEQHQMLGGSEAVLESETEVKAGANPVGAESIWSEILADHDGRHPRTIKKNNFFQPVGTRLETDHSDLCIENCRHNASSNTQREQQLANHNAPNKTINLQLQHHTQPKLSVPPRFEIRPVPRDRTNRKPLFHSVSSYHQFSKSKIPIGYSRRAMYGSEPTFTSLDSDRFTDHNILKPIEMYNRNSHHSKKLVAKHSDIAIQSDLHDFFRIKAVK